MIVDLTAFVASQSTIQFEVAEPDRVLERVCRENTVTLEGTAGLPSFRSRARLRITGSAQVPVGCRRSVPGVFPIVSRLYMVSKYGATAIAGSGNARDDMDVNSGLISCDLHVHVLLTGETAVKR